MIRPGFPFTIQTVLILASGILASGVLVAGCTARGSAQQDAGATAGAPPPPNVVPGADASLFTVDRPEQFPLVAATERPATSELIVTGTVPPDISRNVPVVSLASGRVMAIHARLGDTVQKDQVLLRIRSDDVGLGFDAYRKALAVYPRLKGVSDKVKTLVEKVEGRDI